MLPSSFQEPILNMWSQENLLNVCWPQTQCSLKVDERGLDEVVSDDGSSYRHRKEEQGTRIQVPDA